MLQVLRHIARSALAIAPALPFAMPTAWGAADNCAELRDRIESRIWAAGVAAFSVTVVDAAASAPGRVVGACAQGRRKVVYQRLEPGDTAATPSTQRGARSPTAASAPVITECKDGSVSVGGDCRK